MRNRTSWLCAILALMAVASFAQSPPLRPWQRLSAHSRVLLNTARDLNQMAQAQVQNEVESDLAARLSNLASDSYHALNASSDLLWIFDRITSEGDRSVVGPYINKRLGQYSDSLEMSVGHANFSAPHVFTRRQGILHKS
jgi:hypothetical protein